jgi:hypothetical protein
MNQQEHFDDIHPQKTLRSSGNPTAPAKVKYAQEKSMTNQDKENS